MKSGIELTYPPEYCLCYFPTVIKNLKSIFKVGKLSQKMTISKMETVINWAKRRDVNGQQITDIYAECSIDYVRHARTTRKRFQYGAVRPRSHHSICPLYFNKLGRIKSVHQVFIFKNIAHLIADYTGTANLSVNVGVRMPVNPCIDPAVCYQFAVFFIKHLSFWTIRICYLYF